MSVIKAYSSNSAKVGVDGVPLAGVVLAEEYERHSEYPVLGFGDCVPQLFIVRRRDMSLLSDYFRRDARRYDNGFELY